ncbi:hypothetical protein DFH09DRAFT_425007 [Mycena vulgaris]|nr:hypothetical protein DFH09DRAFT_425007 [Mycena vulgaris]
MAMKVSSGSGKNRRDVWYIRDCLSTRIVSMFDSTEIDIFQLFKPFAETYPAAYETLYKEEPIKGATTGKIFEAAPPPAAVIMDFFAVPQLGATRALSGASVPIVAWVTGGASTILRLFGPESMGGWVILVQRSMPKPHGLEKTLWRSAIRCVQWLSLHAAS